MQASQPDISLSPEESRKASSPQFQKQLEDSLRELKVEVMERPFLWLAIAFIAGSISHTFPVRMLFFVAFRLVSWLAGPTILLMGMIKICDLFSSPQRNAPKILQRP
jgi:flagellar biosynthesis protein FliP